MAFYSCTHLDLICTNNHRSRQIVETEDGVTAWPKCPTCGETTWEDERNAAVSAAYAGVFHPFDYEGVHYATAEQWAAKKRDVAENLKVPLDHIREEVPDRARDMVIADEAAHRGYLGRKRAGVCEQEYRERVREERVRTGREKRISVGYRGTR